MKQAKRLASLLMAIAMVFTLVFAHGNIFGVFAATEEKVLLDQNFENEEIGTNGGWENNDATPDPTPAAGFENGLKHYVAAGPANMGNTSKTLQIDGQTNNANSGITHNLYQKALSEAATSITLTYDVLLYQMSSSYAAVLPVPLYTGIADAAYDVDAAPVQLLATLKSSGVFDLQFSLGKGNYELTGATINAYTWYTFQIEVDLSKETYTEGIKVSFGPKDGVLTEVELPELTKSSPVWRQDYTMDRLSAGFNPGGYTSMYLDNIKATTVAEDAGETPDSTEAPEAGGEETVLDQNFDNEAVGTDGGWVGNTATPEPTPAAGYEEQFKHCVAAGPAGMGNTSNTFEIKGRTNVADSGMTHNLYQKALSKAVENITLTYDVLLYANTAAFGAVLPVPLYTGIPDAAYDADAAPVQLAALTNSNQKSDLYFSLGKGVYEPTGMSLSYYTWYTFQIEVDLSKETYTEGLKVSFGPKGGELTALDLSAPAKENNVPVWRQDATMDRISAGFYPSGYTDMYLDNIKAIAVVEDAGEETTPSETTEAPVVEGYSANLTVGETATVGDDIAVEVAVEHSDETHYAAGEFKVAYDATKVTFVGVEGVSEADAAGIKAVAANGVVTVEDFGVDKELPAAYTLNFEAAAKGDATFTLISAAFSDKEDASQENLEAIVNTPEAATVAIEDAPFEVTIESEYITGNSAVMPGATYTFTVAEPDKYDYTITATMGGETATVVAGENGSYSIANVTGALVINATRTAKVFDVTIDGETAANDGATATYGTDYHFTLLDNVPADTDNGVNYTATVTIGGAPYAGLTHEGQSYTIDGEAIIGDIVITVIATPVSATEYTVEVNGSGAGAAAGFAATGTKLEDYTLTLTPAAGYSYSVTATVDGASVNVTADGNTYTVAAVDGAALVFTVEATVITDNVTVHEYVTLDGTKMWLVLQAQDLGNNSYATYNEQAMFYSAKYNAYAYLVVAETLFLDDAKDLIGVGSGTAAAIEYSNDINMTGKVDANDAQYIYNMYNTVYAGISETETMNEFFLADANGDGIVNVADAVYVVNAINSAN